MSSSGGGAGGSWAGLANTYRCPKPFTQPFTLGVRRSDLRQVGPESVSRFDLAQRDGEFGADGGGPHGRAAICGGTLPLHHDQRCRLKRMRPQAKRGVVSGVVMPVTPLLDRERRLALRGIQRYPRCSTDVHRAVSVMASGKASNGFR